MARLSKMGAAVLVVASAVSMAPTVAPVAAHQTPTVTAPAQQQQRVAVAQQVSARDEMERVREATALLNNRFRNRWDGKNRTAGDRAHKRLKHRRSSGRA